MLTTLVCRYCAAVDAVPEASYNSADQKLRSTVRRAQDDGANHHNRATRDNHALTTDSMADDETEKASDGAADIVNRGHCAWSDNGVSGRAGGHTDTLHSGIGVVELLSKLIVRSDQPTHNTLIIAKEKKGLTAGRCINQCCSSASHVQNKYLSQPSANISHLVPC